jgi:hypothetical protein
MATKLQSDGDFWTLQAASRPVAQFPLGVFNPSKAPIGNPLDLGPPGNRTNLPQPGPAGAWCRPLPLPFSESSPIESRMFWIIVVTGGVILAVFGLSRGVAMPA